MPAYAEAIEQQTRHQVKRESARSRNNSAGRSIAWAREWLQANGLRDHPAYVAAAMTLRITGRLSVDAVQERVGHAVSLGRWQDLKEGK